MRVADIADVVSGAVLPAGDVLLLDDTGDWRGIGTALLLQQLRCRVGLVTADAAVAARLPPAAGGAEARRRFARSGGVEFVHTVVTAWDGTAGRAALRHVLTDRVDEVGADWLVVAETPTAEPPTGQVAVAERVARACPHAAIHVIGDALAPRHARRRHRRGPRPGPHAVAPAASEPGGLLVDRTPKVRHVRSWWASGSTRRARSGPSI